MKHYLPLFLLAFALIGCENNKEAEGAIPAHFSLVGKKYVCDRSNDNPYYEPYFVEVLDFFSTDSAVLYGTTQRDLSPMEEYYNPCQYKLKYPDLTLTFGADVRPLVFKDTTTIYSSWWEQIFLLNF